MTTTDTSPPAAEAPFTHGVASFDPTADSVLLWTRAPGVGRLSWSIAIDEGADPVARGEVDVSAEADHCVTVQVDGLAPATSYVYRFDAGPTR